MLYLLIKFLFLFNFREEMFFFIVMKDFFCLQEEGEFRVYYFMVQGCICWGWVLVLQFGGLFIRELFVWIYVFVQVAKQGKVSRDWTGN